MKQICEYRLNTPSGVRRCTKVVYLNGRCRSHFEGLHPISLCVECGHEFRDAKAYTRDIRVLATCPTCDKARADRNVASIRRREQLKRLATYKD